MPLDFEHHTQFFTSTILDWKQHREYQFWKRNALSIDPWNEKVFIQKLNYIHNNPINYPWNLIQYPEEFKYSSAKFYETGIDEFGLLTHYKD